MSTPKSASAGRRVIVMGVTGCGKTSVGGLLAESLGGFFIDGDALHPEANIQKMASGRPLDDQDREPWLRDIGERLGAAARSGRTLVIGCSALRREYRDWIREGSPDTMFIHLHGRTELLADRLNARMDHFMPASLLQSQLETLEPLEADESGIELDIVHTPSQLAATAAEWIRTL